MWWFVGPNYISCESRSSAQGIWRRLQQIEPNFLIIFYRVRNRTGFSWSLKQSSVLLYKRISWFIQIFLSIFSSYDQIKMLGLMHSPALNEFKYFFYLRIAWNWMKSEPVWVLPLPKCPCWNVSIIEMTYSRALPNVFLRSRKIVLPSIAQIDTTKKKVRTKNWINSKWEFNA